MLSDNKIIMRELPKRINWETTEKGSTALFGLSKKAASKINGEQGRITIEGEQISWFINKTDDNRGGTAIVLLLK